MPNRGHQHWVKKGMVQLEVTKARSLVLAFFGIFFVNFLAISLEMDNWFSGRNEPKNPCGSAWGIWLSKDLTVIGNPCVGANDHPKCGNGTSNQPININQPGDHCDFFLWCRTLEPWKGGCFSQCKHATIGKAVGSNASEDCFGAFRQSCVELTRMRESR